MKKLVPKTPVPVNMLQDIHANLVNFPLRFRERVCEECAWSIPTFYRKMRAADKGGTEEKKLIPAISNAEREKIMSVLDEVFQELWNYCDVYRKKPRT